MEQVLRAMLALRDADAVLDVTDLPSSIRECADASKPSAAATTSGCHSLEAAQGEAIRHALRDHEGNVSSAARALGISRGTLYSKMSRLGLHRRATGGRARK